MPVFIIFALFLFTDVNCIILHSLVSCLLYLLHHSCLWDILACFIFKCQMTDVIFVQLVCVYVTMMNELMGSGNQQLSDM